MLNALWLVKLRWVAIVGQLVTVGFVARGLEIPIATGPLLGGLILTAASNVLLGAWLSNETAQPTLTHRTASLVVAGVMLLDLVVLTFMLYVSGGPTNPFVVFYFVNLALAGVLLEPAGAWLLELVACGGMCLLFWRHWQVEVLSDPKRLTAMSSTDELPLAAVGELVAFVAASGVIVAFMTRLTSQLRSSQHAQRRAEELRARSEKLEALGTLAAGAAHELATPLSTIAVVATEVERAIIQQQGSGEDLPPEVASDLTLVRSELERCRNILNRMSIDSGQLIGEPPTQVTVAELVAEVVEGLGSPQRVTFTSRAGAGERKLEVPRVALAQAIRGLVQNGLDADLETAVALVAEPTPGQPARPQSPLVRLLITDQGPGMPEAVLSRAGEPFFTTKQPGQGMGLGLFLARSVIERLGGELRLDSNEGQGTRAVVDLPCQP